MKLNVRKRALLVGMCTAIGMAYTPQLFATSSIEMEVMQQTKKLTGTVVDQTGASVIGANVIVKGTTNGTITDIDGKFELDMPANGAIIEISFVGYKTQEISLKKGQSVISIVLEDDSEILDEVVVVGYGGRWCDR